MSDTFDAVQGEFRYAGFISYSQKDKRWAKRIHRALEAYRLPTDLAPEITLKKRLGRFFRDDDELAGAPSLSAALETSINASAALIVICSPNSARSKWVDAEIRRFKARGPSALVLAIIVAGRPDDPDPENMCFPPSMLRKVDEDGNLTDEPDEPLAPNATKEPFNRLIVRLVAGLLGLEFDTLWQREQRRRRRQKLILASASILAAIGIGIGTTMYLDAERKRELAEIEQLRSESINLATTAQQAMDEGRVDDALVAALDALPHDLTSPSRQVTPQASAALKRVMNANHAAGIVARFEQPITEMHLLPNNRLAMWLNNDQVRVVNTETGAIDWQSPVEKHLQWLENSALAASISSDESLNKDGELQVQHEVIVHDLKTGAVVRKLQSKDTNWWVGPMAPLSPSAKHLLVTRASNIDKNENDLAIWYVPEIGGPTSPKVIAEINEKNLDDTVGIDSTFVDDDTVLLSWGSPRRHLAMWRIGEPKLQILSAPDSPLTCNGQRLDPNDKRRDKVSFSTDNRILTLARPITDAGWCVELWDTETAVIVATQELEDSFIGTVDALSSDTLAVSPSGRSFLSHASISKQGDEKLRLRDCKAKRSSLDPFNVDENSWLIVPSATFSACAEKTSIQTYHGPTYAERRTLYGHKGKVRALAFDPASSRLYSAGDDGQLRAWNFSDTTRSQPPVGRTKLLAGASDIVARVYKNKEGAILAGIHDPGGQNLIPPLSFSGTNTTTEQSSKYDLDHGLMFVNGGKNIALIETSECFNQCGPDTTRQLTLYRVADGARLAKFDKLQANHFLANVRIEHALTVNEKRMALPRRDGSVTEIETATGELIHTHIINGWHAIDVVYILDSLWILASNQNEDPYKRMMGLFRIDDKDVAKSVWQQKSQSGNLYGSASTRHALVEMDIVPGQSSPVSSGSRFAVVDMSNEVRILDMPTEFKNSHRYERLDAATFYDDDTHTALLFSSEGTPALDIDLTSGVVTTLASSLPASMLDTWRIDDPLGRVVGSNDNGKLFLQQLPGQSPLCPALSGHQADAAAFNPDGTLLAIAENSHDRLTVYDMESCTAVYAAGFGVRHNGQLRFVNSNTLWSIDGEGHILIARITTKLEGIHDQAKKLRKALHLQQTSDAIPAKE